MKTIVTLTQLILKLLNNVNTTFNMTTTIVTLTQLILKLLDNVNMTFNMTTTIPNTIIGTTFPAHYNPYTLSI